jgi:hypothetical protein
MENLRQKLIEAGWRQGALVEPDPSAHADAFAYVVLNQTCDCINPKFETEPWLELLPLVKLPGKPDSRLKNGRNPRQIHFQICEGGKELWVQAKIAEIVHFDRAEQLSLTIASDYSLPPAVLEHLVQWRAARYVRPAFPDAFENAFRLLTDPFAKIIGPYEDQIDSMLISLAPFAELVEGEGYEIELHIMIEPAVMARTTVVDNLVALTSALRTLLEGSPAIASVKCHVTSLDMMSLWEERSFLDFTRYDYLSFGRDEASPESTDP